MGATKIITRSVQSSLWLPIFKAHTDDSRLHRKNECAHVAYQPSKEAKAACNRAENSSESAYCILST